jgi:hypothetical protein
MTDGTLKYLSQIVLDELQSSIASNIERYVSGDFLDLARQYGWAIDAKSVQLDRSLLDGLKLGQTSTEVEVQNSLMVYNALKGMTPSLAREERIWARLTHVECLTYARSRWLRGTKPEELANQIEAHFFAGTLTQTRDDNALGRLWWNGHIASIASPADPEAALQLILKTADIRSNFVERTRMVSRPVLAQALARVMAAEPWITSAESHFREFMKVVNRNGGGILFEVLGAAETDKFLAACTEQAMSHARAEQPVG